MHWGLHMMTEEQFIEEYLSELAEVYYTPDSERSEAQSYLVKDGICSALETMFEDKPGCIDTEVYLDNILCEIWFQYKCTPKRVVAGNAYLLPTEPAYEDIRGDFCILLREFFKTDKWMVYD